MELKMSLYSNIIGHGYMDPDILRSWLTELHLEDLTQLFLQAGYDMPTISRMTPEDLTAIGISKPSVRKRLKTEIGKLSIKDGIPDFKPVDIWQWLNMLHLEEYHDTLVRQGCNMDSITDITWEDLEEIGIKKLGHQKKIMLAIDKLKRLNGSMRRLSSSGGRTTCAEVLSPPSGTTLNDVTYAVPTNTSSLGGSQNRYYDDNFSRSTASSGESRMDSRSFPQNSQQTSSLEMTDAYARSLTPIQVQIQSQPKPLQQLFRQSDFASIVPGRFSNLADSRDQPSRGPVVALRRRSGESDGDTTPTNERRVVSGTAEVKDEPLSIGHYDVPSFSQNAFASSLKPKPVAMVFAKTNSNSRMVPSDVYQKSNEETGESESGRSEPYSYSYSTLPRKFSAKRKIIDSHNTPGYNWTDDNSSLLTNRPSENFGMYTPAGMMGEYRNQSEPPQQSLDGSATGNLSAHSFRNGNAPAPPKRTNSFKTDLRAVYDSVISRTKDADNKNTFITGLDSYDKICENQIFNNLSTAADYRSPLARTESDRTQSPRTLARFNHHLIRPKLSHRVDLASAESLRAAPERFEKTLPLQLEELGAAMGECQKNLDILRKYEDNSLVHVTGIPELKLDVPESRGSGFANISRGGPKLGDWQDNRSTSSSGGDCSSDDSDSGLDSRRSGSTASLESGGMGGSTSDTNTLPFANENVGTIKQRNAALKPSIIAENGNDLNEDLFTDNTGTIKLNRKATTPSTLTSDSNDYKGMLSVDNSIDASENGNHSPGMNSDSVFNDIDGMLQGLHQELDAMLKLQS